MVEPTDPKPARPWRAEPPPPLEPGRLRPGVRRALFIVVLAMVALGGAFVGLLFWIAPTSNPAFVPLFVTQYRARPFPTPAQARNDREALHQGNYFPRWQATAAAPAAGHVLRRDLLALRALDAQETVVVHLTALALRDEKGNVVVLPADADPDHPQRGLPLREVLKALGDCRARHKLFILDVMRPLADAWLGALTDDVAAGALAEVQALGDPHLLVLCACAPGQVSLASEAMGRSVFGFYLEEGLRGWADGYGEGKRDGHVSARELAAFVRARVDRWAVRNCATRQTPLLLGSAPDFLLRSCDEGKSPGHVAEVPAEQYPKALRAAWLKRDQLYKDGAYRLAPHLCRQAEALLLRAEQDWRGGVGVAAVESDHLAALERLLGEIGKAKALPHPEAPSLALAAALGAQVDPTVEKGLRELVTKLQALSADLKAEDAAKERARLASEFAAKSAALPAFARDRAVFELAADIDPVPERLLTLAGLLRHPTETLPRHVETLVLRRLAELAARKDAAPWPTETARLLLGVTQRGEQAISHPRAFAWNAGLLERAAQDRHEGEVLFWARGYASPLEAQRLLKQADEGYRAAETRAGVLERALDTFEDALALLPSYAPYLEAAPQNVKSWHDAVRAAGDLYDLLHPQAPADGSTSLDRLQETTEALRGHLEMLRRPFAADRLAQLQRLSRLPRPEVAVLRDIDALLATPFPEAAGRAALWEAGRELEGRLHRGTVALDREDDELRQPTPAQGDFDRDRAEREERAHAQRRALASRALLELGGLRKRDRADPLSEALDRARRGKDMAGWYALSATLRQAWARLPARLEEETSLPALDRLSRIVPAFDAARGLAKRDQPPAVQLRLGEQAALFAWLADRYRYQSRAYRSARLDAHLTSAEDFYAQAARACGTPPPQPYVEMSSEPLEERLTPAHPAADCRLRVRAVRPTGATEPVPVKVLLADGAWLKVKAAPADEAGEVRLHIELQADAEDSRVAPPRGFLVEAKLGDRTFHHKVTVPLDTPGDRPQVLLSTNPLQAVPSLSEIRLRPGKVRQPFYLFVRNPTGAARKLLVELKTGDPLFKPNAVAVTVGPNKTEPVAPGEAPKVETPSKQPLDLPKFQGPLTVRLLDGDRKNAVLAERQFRVEVMNPREYVRMREVKFTPGSAADGFNHKLTVQLAAALRADGPDIPVELVLPHDRIPGLLGAREGIFRGKLPGKRAPELVPLTLFAQKIELADGEDEDGTVYIHADGYERAFVFHTTFARRGDPTTPRWDGRPALRLRGEGFLRAGTDARLVVEADNAPDGSALECSRGKLQAGKFVAEAPPVKLPGARQRVVGFTPFGAGGALVFEASVQDWALPPDMLQVLGRHVLRVRLLDAGGRELAQALHTVTVGDTGPDRVQFVGAPKKVKRGTAVLLKATASDAVTGIRAAAFFLGKPIQDKVPPGAALVQAEPVDRSRTTWAAKVPLPEDRKGPTEVSVVFTNRVGLSNFATTTIELTDTDPRTTGPGSIRGRVLRGPRPQADLDVALADEKGAVKDRTKTKADGTFVFAEVAAGKYRVWAFRPDAQMRGFAPAVVRPNQETPVRIELSLVSGAR